MKKYLLTIIFVLIVGFSYSQNNNNIIIGIGQSDDQEIFNEIKEYTLKCKRDMCVITICEKHKVIAIEILSEKYKDPQTLISTFEKIFPNTDFLIKEDDDILKTDCKDEYLKYKNNR